MSLLDIGFSTNVLDNPADVVGAVRTLSNHFRSIEFELGEAAEQAVYEARGVDYQRVIEGIRQICVEKKVYLSVHAPYIGHNLAADNDSTRCASIERLLRALDIAADLGSNKVTFHPGLNLGRSPSETIPPLLKSLDEIVPEAECRGITLCLENMGTDRPTYIVYSAEQHERICRTTGIQIALDVIHLASTTPDELQFDEELHCLAPFVGNMHIADMHIPAHVHIPIGKGNLPLTRILQLVASYDYQGPAIVEEFGGPYSTQVFIDQAVAYRTQVNAEGLR